MFYLFIFFIPFLTSLILTPLFKKTAEKYHLYDIAKGDVLKIHKKPISVFGGLAMLIAVIIGLLFFVFQRQVFDWRIAGIILGSLIVFLLGFWDDLKWKHISQIKPYQKFSLLIIFPLIATIILLASGIKINFFPGIYLAGFLTFSYIFVFMNGINYQDGMDGLAGGLVAISLIGFFVLALISGNDFALILSFILLGAVFGFLIFNFPPAKIFMGDSGAYFLGFILAVLAMIFSKSYNFLSILGPIFIVGIPIFDGVFTNIRRLFSKKSIFLGDRRHFYDRILQRGISTKKTLLICFSLQIISVAIGILIYY
ncbi:undecaprenyl/decaprenyl-phosphate alpha-N-acetylglucosaminyl 1-phosphate transferase [Candidatus Parcubacteria bacterium]|nr:undecaprenyl/decaprenyl-phosphate alpha-N-acetylglucosaminyl 1-phosphate transferase [Candidatus Parcubacteria bacterium]